MEQNQEFFSSFFPILVAVVIGFVVAHFIRNTANKYPAVSPDANTVSGVGGWLLLLILAMMFIEPFIGAYNLNLGLLNAEYQIPELVTTDAWSTYKLVTWSVFIPMACLSFYAGLCLVKIRHIIVVKRAIIVLWITGPVGNLVLGMLLPAIILDGSLFKSDFSVMIVPMIITVIWTAYLSKSKRVKATYGNDTQNT